MFMTLLSRDKLAIFRVKSNDVFSCVVVTSCFKSVTVEASLLSTSSLD